MTLKRRLFCRCAALAGVLALVACVGDDQLPPLASAQDGIVVCQTPAVLIPVAGTEQVRHDCAFQIDQLLALRTDRELGLPHFGVVFAAWNPEDDGRYAYKVSSVFQGVSVDQLSPFGQRLCDAQAQQGVACELAQIVEPRGYDPDLEPALGRSAGIALLEQFGKEGFGAIAVIGTGSTNVLGGYATRQEADAIALASCEEAAQRGGRNLPYKMWPTSKPAAGLYFGSDPMRYWMDEFGLSSE